eukprot:NODE_1165_length_1068_cov_170.882237_g890_i0.p2 GENE.NODE_1165_length_1068_cov_170.882237_g890_i0~~NODE_1165_length_1068_cov_170.882237_g890_i0.p2  ORF type:complete len:276 (+),score=55.03 NODE_1165_length_1068_cov_170.882237_g890_i0:105-932(+)
MAVCRHCGHTCLKASLRFHELKCVPRQATLAEECVCGEKISLRSCAAFVDPPPPDTQQPQQQKDRRSRSPAAHYSNVFVPWRKSPPRSRCAPRIPSASAALSLNADPVSPLSPLHSPGGSPQRPTGPPQLPFSHRTSPVPASSPTPDDMMAEMLTFSSALKMRRKITGGAGARVMMTCDVCERALPAAGMRFHAAKCAQTRAANLGSQYLFLTKTEHQEPTEQATRPSKRRPILRSCSFCKGVCMKAGYPFHRSKCEQRHANASPPPPPANEKIT